MKRAFPAIIAMGLLVTACAEQRQQVADTAAKVVPGAKGAELVAYPEGYATKFARYATQDRANPKQIAELFVNDVGQKGLKANGTLPSGTVLVMEVHNAKVDAQDKPILENGKRVKNGLGTVSVMEKRTGWGTDYPAELRNGEWEYAAFDPATKKLRSTDTKACFECHAKGPGAAADYVFSAAKLPR